MAHEFQMKCLPEQDPIVTSVNISEGWSKSANDKCLFVKAWNTREPDVSVTVEAGYPTDCIPVPEFSFVPGLMLGVILVSAWGRRRSRTVSPLRLA